jgi:hypothetical protein
MSTPTTAEEREKATTPQNGHAHMKSVDIPSLPTPATQTKPAKFQLSAATIIPIWISISSGVIIYNNYVYNTLQFKYPVFLVTFHLTFAVSTAL